MGLHPWVCVLAAIMSASIAPALAVQAREPLPPSPLVTYNLCGRFLGGWGFTCATTNNPGPTLTAAAGESVTLNLLAGDYPPYTHRWLLDHNGNGLADGDEPWSGLISSPTNPLVFPFTIPPGWMPGTYSYICTTHGAAYMSGLFVVSPPTGPTISLTNPSATPQRWTGGSTHTLTWTMSDPDDPVTSLTVYLNYSYNGGATTGTIAGPLAGGQTSFAWIVPAVNTPDMHVLATVLDPSNQKGNNDKAVPVIDSVPPTVTTVDPANGAPQASRATWLNVTFSEPMNKPATEGAVSLCRMPGCANVPLTVVGWTGNTLTVRPNAPLAADADYQGTVSTTAKDESDAGNALTAPFLWAFHTANQPPAVSVTSPAAGVRWTGGTAHALAWTASDAEDPPAALSVWVNYSATGAAPWTAVFSGNGATTTYTWTLPLDDTTAARLEVTAVDTAGAKTVVPSAAFAVDSTPPILVSTNPAEGAMTVALNANLLIVFSERMNQAATGARSVVGLQDFATSGWVSLAFLWDGSGTQLTADPVPLLQGGRSYRLYVNASARDVADPGLTLVGGSMVNFTTSTAPDVTKPTIIDVAATPATQVPSGTVEVSANVTDEAGVASVSVNVTLPDGTTANQTMTHGTGNRWSSAGPWTQLGLHRFRIWAIDTSGNAASASGSFTIKAPDTTPPTVTHTPPGGTIYAGAAIVIAATVTDNNRVGEVRILYRDVSGAEHNETMTFEGGPYGDLYAYTIPAQPSAGTVRYRIAAVDATGNWRLTSEFSLTIAAKPSPPSSVAFLAGGVAVAIVVAIALAILLQRRRKSRGSGGAGG